MIAGQQAYAPDGVQVALFPLDYMYCTQKPDPDAYTHCCGNATDWIGTTDNYPYYAPFNCHRIDYDSSNGNAVYLSDTEVWTPAGKRFVVCQFMHDNSVPSQTSFVQGQLIGHTGIAGNVTGDHVHIECAEGQTFQWVNGGTCSSGRTCWTILNSKPINTIFYLTGSEQQVFLDGITFLTWTGQITLLGGEIIAPILSLIRDKRLGKRYVII